MKPISFIDNSPVSESDSNLLRKTNLFNAWFVRLDKEKRSVLRSGRFRLLFLSIAILGIQAWIFAIIAIMIVASISSVPLCNLRRYPSDIIEIQFWPIRLYDRVLC